MRSFPSNRTRRWGLTDAVVGLLLALALLAIVPSLKIPGPWSLPVAYLAVWIPLLGAVLVASFLRGQGSLARDFGLRFTVMDLLVGLFVGLALRLVVFGIELLTLGSVQLGGPILGPAVHDWWWLFAAVLAPVFIAPVIEELFFRGLLQQALPGSAPLVVVVSASAFALLHLATGSSWVAALSTLIVGITLGTLAARSGRLGAAIVAHAAFNGCLVALLLFG